ncbi:MAG: DUF1015 domain-containing protein [Armatimonadota bacterium]
MATVRPFRGVMYNQKKVGNLNDVVTPPYDVISPVDQQAYYDRNPYSVVRLILPKEDESAGPTSKYESSASYLNKWLDDGILQRDDNPALYAIRQQYEINGEVKQRLGFTCLVKLEDYSQGTVLPHENILAKPMDDRLNMLRFTMSNYDSVFGLYADRETETILGKEIQPTPDAFATDKDGVLCELWKISDTNAISGIMKALEKQSILIADGHHRYAAALAFRDEMRKSAGTINLEAPYEYVMMTLVSLDDPGLVVLPTHRMIRNLESFNASAFINQLSEHFEISEIAADTLTQSVEALFSKGHAFGLCIGRKAYTVMLKPNVRPEELIATPGSAALKNLDVTILHTLILDRYLGIGSKQMAAQSNLTYTRSADEAIRLMDEGTYQMAFLMNPTRVSEVRAIAASGEKMPQKSTFFYPKLLAGMIIRLIAD